MYWVPPLVTSEPRVPPQQKAWVMSLAFPPDDPNDVVRTWWLAPLPSARTRPTNSAAHRADRTNLRTGDLRSMGADMSRRPCAGRIGSFTESRHIDDSRAPRASEAISLSRDGPGNNPSDAVD